MLASTDPKVVQQQARQRNLREYYPHELSERQKRFLGLDEYEAFYGGAAGGGKSDALLAAALEYVHVPGYRAIIFRRTCPNLDDLIERTHEWLHGKADWTQQKLRWRFPSGATLRFGHMQHDADKFNYKGPAFQFVGWDELSEFLETQYGYLFSRIRRPECQKHKPQFDPQCQTCQFSKHLAQVPLRVRSASNPDGEGRLWVRKMFVSDEAADAICSGVYGDLYYNEYNGRRIPMVPSRIEDNPGLDQESYIRESLDRLDPISRARLRVGDWRVQAAGLIRAEWLRYYTMRGQHIQLLGIDGRVCDQVDERECQRIVTIDTAGTSEDKDREAKGKPHSWSVAQVWDYLPSRYGRKMVLRHQWRERVNFPDLKERVRTVNREWRPSRLVVERAHFGDPLYYDMRNEGLPFETIDPAGKGKAERAKDLFTMLDSGEVFLPHRNNPGAGAFLGELESEWLSWQGTKDEVADQIDPASYAATLCGQATSSWGGVIFSGGLTR